MYVKSDNESITLPKPAQVTSNNIFPPENGIFCDNQDVTSRDMIRNVTLDYVTTSLILVVEID